MYIGSFICKIEEMFLSDLNITKKNEVIYVMNEASIGLLPEEYRNPVHNW